MRKAALWTLLFLPIICLAGPAPPGIETDKRIDQALFYYYNGQTQEAKNTALGLKDSYPDDAFVHELMAEIIWKELEKKVEPNSSDKARDKQADYKLARNNTDLVEQFNKEIYDGLVLTQAALRQNPNDVRGLFLRGMLLVRHSGFIAKFQGGWRSLAEVDELDADGLILLQKSAAIDPTVCSAKCLFFALSKNIMIKNTEGNILKRWAVRYRSRTYAVVGNFEMADVFRWARESMSCQSDYYWTRDVEIDKKLFYQDLLVYQAENKLDEEVLPVLEELVRTYPDNLTLRHNLQLVRNHLGYKKQYDPR